MANDDDDDSRVMGNVTLPYTTVERMKNARRQAEKEVAEARKRVAALELSGTTIDPEAIGHVLARGIRHALSVVQWAQGNYDPETVKGWPHEDLAALALIIRQLPGVTQNELEWATDAIHYASAARAVERARQLGRQHEIKNIPRSSMVDGSYVKAIEQMINNPPVTKQLPQVPSADPTNGAGAAALVGQVAEQAQQQQAAAGEKDGQAEAKADDDKPADPEPKPGN